MSRSAAALGSLVLLAIPANAGSYTGTAICVGPAGGAPLWQDL